MLKTQGICKESLACCSKQYMHLQEGFVFINHVCVPSVQIQAWKCAYNLSKQRFSHLFLLAVLSGQMLAMRTLRLAFFPFCLSRLAFSALAAASAFSLSSSAAGTQYDCCRQRHSKHALLLQAQQYTCLTHDTSNAADAGTCCLAKLLQVKYYSAVQARVCMKGLSQGPCHKDGNCSS